MCCIVHDASHIYMYCSLRNAPVDAFAEGCCVAGPGLSSPPDHVRVFVRGNRQRLDHDCYDGCPSFDC